MDSSWYLPSRYVQRTVPSRKVVSVPVQFVGSGGLSRLDSAVKIQKAFRGFRVRKSVRAIVAIRREVEEMERRVSEESTVEAIRNNPKETLRVSEALMSLLFRLDSVKGVDSAVRDCRKAVIRRAIALQEIVDNIVVGSGGSVHEEASEAEKVMGEAVDEGQEVSQEDDEELRGQAAEIEISGAGLVENGCILRENSKNLESVAHVADGVPSSVDSAPYSSETSIKNDGTPKLQDLGQAVDPHCENSEKLDLGRIDDVCIETKVNRSEEIAESGGTGHSESETGSSANPESLVEEVEENSPKQDEGMEIVLPQRKEEVGVREDCGGAGGREESKQGRELLERMMKDNERMMGLMTELLERNEMQTRLLCSLSQRVELLEKAFMCEKLRRKKKRNAVGVVESSEKSPDARKSGQR